MVLGNPDLKPESSNSFQLGGQFVWRDQLTLDINAFYNDLDDLIQTDLASPDIVSGIAVYTYENIGRARTAGVETGARWQPSAQWLVEGAYTYTDTRDLDTGQELTRRPRNMGVIGLNWNPSAATRVSLRGRYQGSELIDTATGTRSPAWATLDVTLNQQLAPGVVAFAGINNLFDRQRNFDDPADFGPVAGRYFQIGLRVALGD
jgi:outer membrane receptor for ferrienterochelin and colicins